MDGNIFKSNKKMGLKPYFTYLMNPWLKPGAMDEKYFLLNHSQLHIKNHLNAVLNEINLGKDKRTEYS